MLTPHQIRNLNLQYRQSRNYRAPDSQIDEHQRSSNAHSLEEAQKFRKTKIQSREVIIQTPYLEKIRLES